MPLIELIEKEKILAGRKAVDAYREAHRLLHSQSWHKGIPEAHTPLLEQMLKDLSKQGFYSLDEFFRANYTLNKETFETCYQWKGECDGCPNREKGCVSQCFAERGKYSEKYKCSTIAKTKIETFEDGRAYIEYYGTPKTDGSIIPNCKYKLVKIAEPDIDWRWH